MKKKNFIFIIGLIAALLCGKISYGQVINRAWEKDEKKDTYGPNEKLGHVSNRLYVPYPYIREADVMWSKRVWRTIDLREKMNMPLYYPIKKVRDRKNLYMVLLEGLMNGDPNIRPVVDHSNWYPPSSPNYGNADRQTLTPFYTEELKQYYTDSIKFTAMLYKDTLVQQIDGDGDPSTPITSATIGERTYVIRDIFGNETRKTEIANQGGIDQEVVIIGPPPADSVFSYDLVEDWFFDKQRGEMVSRIISIAPVIWKTKTVTLPNGDVVTQNIKVPLFWLYFPEIRPILANNEVYNRHNNAERRSFDDFFQKRFFSSYITKEENVYDRTIDEYAKGLNALLEAERIKNDIFIIEHDLWEW